MKLAHFSPMPPAKTGIATYSSELVRALARHCDVTVFTETVNADPLEAIPIVDFHSDPRALKSLEGFDHILYHVGNNPYFHLDIWKALTLFPGAVCLHDTVVYYLAAGLGAGGLLKELLLEDPRNAFGNLAAIRAACPGGELLRYPTPSLHPCNRGLLEVARHLIVHNESSALALRDAGYSGRLDVIPLLHYGDPASRTPQQESVRIRHELGFAPGDFVFGAFGFIGPTKRLDKVLSALAAVRDRDPATPARLLIVGEGDPLQESIRALGLESIVRTTGFVPDRLFGDCLGAVDAVINLRYPSHGESSASLIQAMLGRKVCLVTDHAFFAELPDAAVVKIPFNETEAAEIERAMEQLLREPAMCRRIGDAARAHVLARHAPNAVAARFVATLAASPSHNARSPRDEFDAVAQLEARVHELVP